MLYRIYTEDKNRYGIEKLLRSEFQSFTLIEVLGCWQGETEYSLIIEIMGDSYLENAVTHLARDLAKLNRQACVIVQRLDCTVKTINGPASEDAPRADPFQIAQ